MEYYRSRGNDSSGCLSSLIIIGLIGLVSLCSDLKENSQKSLINRARNATTEYSQEEKYEAYPYTQNWIVNFDKVVEDLEPTGIHSVTLDKETGNKAIYDLNGRRIQNVPSRGIYIQNGKKISVK